MKSVFLLLSVVCLFIQADEPEHGWNSPALVAKKVIKSFDGLDSYTANFQIETKQGYTTKKMSGRCIYKKDGKMRFDFESPGGDVLVSDGKTLWIFIRRLNAVGVQNLTLEKKRDNQPVFSKFNGPGLKRLFRKYHYRFDDLKQPRLIDGKSYFVLDLKQKVKIGGFASIVLYIDSKSYLIRRAVATNDFGLSSTISFSDIQLNKNIKDGIFKFNIPGSAKIVQNPLVNE